MFPIDLKLEGVDILSVERAKASKDHVCAWNPKHNISKGSLHVRVSWKDRRNGANKLENDHICIACWTS